MTPKTLLQDEKVFLEHISVLLKYFKDIRGIKVKTLAEKIGYKKNYLTHVRKGNKNGSDKLLRALENFYLLDNMNRAAIIKSQIRDLEREEEVLRSATVEKFYAERVPIITPPSHPLANNDAPNSAPEDVMTPAAQKALDKALSGSKGSVPGQTTPKSARSRAKQSRGPEDSSHLKQ